MPVRVGPHVPKDVKWFLTSEPDSIPFKRNFGMDEQALLLHIWVVFQFDLFLDEYIWQILRKEK